MDETVAEVLRECELCLANVARRIKAAEDEKKRAKMTSMKSGCHFVRITFKIKMYLFYFCTTAESKAESKFDDKEDFNMSTIRPYNQRIDLETDEDVAFDIDYDDDGQIDLDDEVLSREKVKMASSQILQAIDRRKKKSNKVSTGSSSKGGGRNDQSKTSGEH